MLGLMKLLRFDKKEDDPPPSGKRDARRAATLCHRLLEPTGEVTALQTAAEAVSVIRSLDSDSLPQFVDALAEEFSAGGPELERCARAYAADPTSRNLAALQRRAESPRMELFRQLSVVADAAPALVGLRSRMLQAGSGKPAWNAVSEDLRRLFEFWFNRGFLTLERINWNSSAAILEKLIRYEAVHEIRGFPDLRRRLESDRRCYAFFHPAMPGEPLVFVEIALTRGPSSKVGPLLDSDSQIGAPEQADTAVFYSITNCQSGLRGVPFGSFLIKQVVEDLRRDLPGIRRFVTLSPVPGFRSWLKGQPEFERLKPFLDGHDWTSNTPESRSLEPVLTGLCAHYLLRVKKGDEPLDSVARFHLRNGARLDRINWRADLSERGVENSFGLMVNYAYRPREIEFNHERYVTRHKIAADTKIEAMAKHAMASIDLMPAATTA